MPIAMNKPVLARPVQKRAKIFYGWWIVGIGMVLDAVRQGAFNTGFAVYFLPVQRDLGLSRAAISLAFSLGRLENSLEGPVVGYLNAWCEIETCYQSSKVANSNG